VNMVFLHKDNKEKEFTEYIKNVFGFTPKKSDFYKIAFIHKSASCKNAAFGLLNNERLEYLGDAILSAVVADFLFKKFPFFAEGPLTEMRSKIVCRERLNYLSKKIGLDKLMMIDEHVFSKSVNGDALEALIGAIYLDKGYNSTKKILLKIIQTHLDLDAILFEESNYKSKILSWGQKYHKRIEFNHTEIYNHSKKKLYKVQLQIDKKTFGEGMDYTIKKAEQIAASKSWELIEKNNQEEAIANQN
jgi:ribonuclease III